MCESGKQWNEGEISGARVDQLRRFIWLLMIWVSVLSLGLGASITLHFIKHQEWVPHQETTSKPTPTPTPNRTPNPTPKLIPTTQVVKNPRNQLTSYDCFEPKEKGDLLWRKKNETPENSSIKIEEDGNYFLFLRVTLLEPKHGGNYTVRVYKKPEGSTGEPDVILDGDITGTQMSTGFMGIVVGLSDNTLLSVNCTPTARIDVKKTYLGLIRF